MKNKRQSKILQLVSSVDIQTQEELMTRLNDSGFNVTQATVSRDIKELKLIKVSGSNGKYRYSQSAKKTADENGTRFLTLCRHSAVSSDFAGNICVVRCMSGSANALCAALDSVETSGLVGTIAGDDTIFALFRTPEEASAFSVRVLAWIHDEEI